jgi:nucleoside-diphosphate-sugar epimerase
LKKKNLKKYRENLRKINTIIIGGSGLIGSGLSKIIKSKDTLFVSRKKPKAINKTYWKKIDLDKKLYNLPKKVKKIFFLSSPYYLNKNLKKKNFFFKELLWLKKVLKNIDTEKLIYMSSSSVYLKNHIIGKVKIDCEKFLKKYKIKYLQIWRPFNLVGDYENQLSDHFHNLLIKKFLIKKIGSFEFYGSKKNRRGYSSVNKFCKIINKESNKNKNFIYNYGNTNTISIDEIVKIFKKIVEKKYNRTINITFKKNNKNANVIKKNKKIYSFNSKENSKKILKNYFKYYKNEKK